MLNIWKHINKERFVFDFITFSNKLDFEEELTKNGGRVYYMSVHPEENKEKFVEEFNKILNNGYDVIEIHTSYWVNTIVEKMAKKANISRIIIHAHSTGIGINETWNKEKRDYYISLHNKIRGGLNQEIATDFWACSREAAEWLFADRIPYDKVEILNNTIDTAAFAYNKITRRKYRSKLGLDNSIVIGFTGRLEKVKNISFLIDVFYEVIKTKKNVCLLLVGDGKIRAELEEQCNRLGLIIGEDVIFLGFVDNVSDYLQVMDIFAMPSYFEGFSLATLEAQCSGLGCVVSDAIPKAIEITDLVRRLSLDKRLWIKEINNLMRKFERKDRSDELRQKGFDTDIFISELEKKYGRRS